jgi:hypothetical protein
LWSVLAKFLKNWVEITPSTTVLGSKRIVNVIIVGYHGPTPKLQVFITLHPLRIAHTHLSMPPLFIRFFYFNARLFYNIGGFLVDLAYPLGCLLLHFLHFFFELFDLGLIFCLTGGPIEGYNRENKGDN